MGKKLFVGIMFVLISAVCAQASITTFDTFTPFDVCLGTIQDGGLQVNGGNCTGVWDNNPNGNGTLSLISAAGATLSQVGGGPFDLSSVDATISWYNGNPGEALAYQAFFFGGGSTVGGLLLGQGLQTYSLGLFNLDHIDFGALSTGYWLMDNVDSSVKGSSSSVPEPTSISLLALGVVGVLVARKRLAQV